MKVGVVREIHKGERRVAATPQTVLRLIKAGFGVMIETGAGAEAGYADAEYAEAGAEVVPETRRVWNEADVMLKVRAPERHEPLGTHEADLLREGGRLISFVWPAQNKDLLDHLARRKATVLAMDCVPRITRAQRMDALSAMANIAGYRAVVEAAAHFPRFFGGQITAAGKVEPAKVLVIGAGVAGLAAVGAARGLGAVVRAFDTRAAVREQVRSMGAEFLEVSLKEEGEGGGGYAREMSPEFIKAEMELFAAQAMQVDIIITTALIPGKRAPELITAGMVETMAEGSVIVDLAAEQGGNCTLTRPGEVVVAFGVSIVGFTDLTSRMASQSSQLYGTNLVHMLDEMCGGGGAAKFGVDVKNEVVRGALVLHDGELTWPPPRPAAAHDPKMAPPAPPVEKPKAAHGKAEAKPSGPAGLLWIVLGALALLLVGWGAPESFLSHFTVFVLACFVGWQLVWSVSPALHTPLMSVTNAISGIIIIGGMLQLRAGSTSVWVLGAVAVLLATINIAGGFLVTGRMLAMFRR